MKKTIAARIDYKKECQARSLRVSVSPITDVIPEYYSKEAKITSLTFYYREEKKDIILSLKSGKISLEEARLRYNNLLKSILEYLKNLILPRDCKGIFMTITGSLTKDLATFDSDVDIDIFSRKEDMKSARKLFNEFSSKFESITGHKIEPFFKAIAGYDIFHMLYPNLPSSTWGTRQGIIGRKILWILKKCCDLLHKLIHLSPFRNTFIGKFCFIAHNNISGLLINEDVEFYREYFSAVLPFGFHPNRHTIAPNFFWGDNELFLYLFPQRHLITRESSPSYKLALSKQIPLIILNLYLRMLFKKPFKSVFKLFPIIPLLGFILRIQATNYSYLVNELKIHPKVNKHLGTDFINAIDFYYRFKFALSVFRILRKSQKKNDALEILAKIMNSSSIEDLIVTAKIYLYIYNETLLNLRSYYYYLIQD